MWPCPFQPGTSWVLFLSGPHRRVTECWILRSGLWSSSHQQEDVQKILLAMCAFLYLKGSLWSDGVPGVPPSPLALAPLLPTSLLWVLMGALMVSAWECRVPSHTAGPSKKALESLGQGHRHWLLGRSCLS